MLHFLIHSIIFPIDLFSITSIAADTLLYEPLRDIIFKSIEPHNIRGRKDLK